MFNLKYLILFNIFFTSTNSLNPRKLLLQRRTEDYDKEYYDYYGSSSDSYENVKLKFTKHGRYKVCFQKMTSFLMNQSESDFKASV